jgi:O-antigen/teichoic acid export membrane protein
MGVIKRQTIKGSIYSYIGLTIGFFFTIISTKLFTTEQIGLTAILVAVSAMYSQFATLGFTKVIERLFPYFRDKDKNHNGFLFLTLAVGMIGFVISVGIFLILKSHIIESNIKKSPLLVEYIWYLVPLIFFRMLFLMLDTYNKMLFDATTGSILSDFVFRLGTIILLGAFFLDWINFPLFVFGYMAFLSFPSVYLAGLLIYRKQFNLQPNLGYIKSPLRKEMTSLSFYGMIIGFSAVALKNVDTIMMNTYTNMSLTGVYNISFYFGTVILIPGVALGKISSTIIAEAWKNKDMETIDDIYYKSSINQLFAALLLFILMVTNLHNIFKILKPEYKGGEWVIILIALSNLIVASTGSSVQIIGTSHKYKIQTYSMGMLLAMVVVFYMIFIPLWGMTGAALGSLLSVAGASLFRVFYLRRNMKLFPYRMVHLKCVAIGLLAFAVGKIIPVIDNFLIDLIVRCSAISVVFIGLSYLFHISEDMNQIVNKFLKQFRIIK